MATHSSILAGKVHGQRSSVGCSPWGYRLNTHTCGEWREVGWWQSIGRTENIFMYLAVPGLSCSI